MDKHQNQQILSDYLNELRLSGKLNKLSYQKGRKLYEFGKCHLLSSTPNDYHFEVDDDYQDFNVSLNFADKLLETKCTCGASNTCAHVYACLEQTQQEMSRSFLVIAEKGLQYSREGMVKRVLEERRNRATLEEFQIEFAENIHGEHILTTSRNNKYELSFYDFEKNLGYCSCPDYQTNKLETCKHLIYAFDKFEDEMGNNELPNQPYPFLEIFRHPLHDYQISWFYPQILDNDLKDLLTEYFDENQLWKADKWPEIHQFIEKSLEYKLVKVRPEVNDLIEDYFETESLANIYTKSGISKDIISPGLFPYQVEGAQFVASKKGSFLADEIGLGKSAQAISAGILKIRYSNFSRIHIICPQELMTHWKEEVIKWVPEHIRSQFVVFGMNEISSCGSCDFLIIDEAQKIEDYESGLVGELANLDYKHIVLVTDSKYENSLMKFHAVSTLIDKHMLTPLWELSYKHCLFDPNIPDKTIAYHHLELVGKRIEKFYLRRERAQVLDQLPPSQLMEISVALNQGLKSEQGELAKNISSLCVKNHLNKYDWFQFRDYLKEMLQIGRFNTSQKYIASQTPKMHEFTHFVLHKLNVGTGQKVIVFAEGKDLQNRIIRALNQERLNASLYEEGLEKDGNIQYLIAEEDGVTEFVFAHHFVYFHIPGNPVFIEKRLLDQQKHQSGIEQSLFYLMKSVQSFESLILDWQKNKPYFVEQLLAFIYQGQSQRDLSLRLREELAHEMKPLSPEKNVGEVQDKQMDLFGEEVQIDEKTPKKYKSESDENKTEMESFIRSLFSLWNHFENLDPNQKRLLKKGSVQVENKKGEIIIRIQKK